MKIELQRVAPAEIEARSMEIIRSELKRPAGKRGGHPAGHPHHGGF